MTTPSPQPQPDGDWATKAAEEIQSEFVHSMHNFNSDIAEIIRRHAPAPAPAPSFAVGAVNELVEAVEVLRQHLDNDGEYSICRSDHKPMGLGEVIGVGEAMERIDRALIKVKGGGA
jgi:hypothetical protein